MTIMKLGLTKLCLKTHIYLEDKHFYVTHGPKKKSQVKLENVLNSMINMLRRKCIALNAYSRKENSKIHKVPS